MTTRKSLNVDSLSALLLSFLFTALIFGLCMLVAHIRPYSPAVVIEAPISAEENPDTGVEADAFCEEFVEETPVIDEAALAVNMQKAVISHADLADKGLEMYRDLATRTQVIWFYNQITGNQDVTEAILYYADHNDIPLSLAFALAWTESRYNQKAQNTNKNASVDRGLFQLNNKSFPALSEEDFFNPYVSARNGLSHLRYCLDTAGNEVAALAMYNAGTTRVRNNTCPQSTLNYVSKIMDYQQGLDELFEAQIVNAGDTSINSNAEMLALILR